MENKNKLFGYVPSLSEFNKLKVSADIDNKTYTIGGGSVQQCAEGEVPDVRWHIVVFIEDVTRIWTHGKFYASANAKLSDDYASPVYVEVKDLETGEVLFNPAKPGETIEEAILQLDTNVANLLAEILKNEEVVSTALNELNLSSGFNDNGKYIQQTTAKYISGATSLADADNLLDSAISSIAANVEALSGDLSGLFIPTKTSDLTNDSGYITSAAIPTKVSAFTNDAGYITSAAIPTNVSAFTNDAGYITSAAIPTKVSAFDNDAKYQTESDVKAAIDGLINGAPGTLDTLGEIAEILSENTDGIGALVEELAKKANTADVNAALNNKADNTTVNDLSETVDDVKDALDSITGSTNNVYTANGSAQYINTATSLKDADNKLDAAIAGVASELSNLSTEVSKIEIPTKVSAFDNDAKYAYQGDIPTKVSQLENDSKYLTSYYVPTKVSEFENDANYATKSEIPTKLGQLTNDANYAKVSDIPTTTSQLTNNSGFITMSDVEAKKYITIDQVPEVSVPQNLSQYNNDAGFITISDVEAKDYATKAELPTVPTNVSSFTNDAGYITAADVPEVSKDLSQYDNTTSKFVSESELESKNYITLDDVPEVSKDLSQYDNTTSKFVSESELTNKNYTTMSEVEAKGYITAADVPEVSKDLSQYDNTTSKFVNESELESKNYITLADVPEVDKDLSKYDNTTSKFVSESELEAKDYATKSELPTVPTNVSEFTNDANYATTTYVTTELEKKANNTLTQDSKVYPEVTNLETQEILFTNIVAGDTLEAAILKTDANTATLVEEVLKNEEVISTTLNQHNLSSGFGEDAKYIQKTNANYISGATSLAEADDLLDNAIKAVETSVGNMHIPTTVAELTDASNYAKKTDLPVIPTNVSAFTNDANYATKSELPTIPTKLSAFENDCAYMTATEVEAKVASLVDSAPETLNTLNELAAALGDDPNFATTISTEIGKKADLTYVTSELEKKANSTVAGEFDVYPVLKNTHTGEELFVNCHDGIAVSDAIHNIDKNTYTLVGEIIKNEEVISNAFNKINTSVGFDENANFVVKENANVIGEATNLTEAVNILDTTVGELANELDSINVALSDEYQSAVYPDDLTSGEFVAPVAGDNLDTAIGKLDTNVATLVDETLKIEETVSAALNRLNKSAGFDVNGIYHPAENANVIGEATSLKEAVDLLDENLAIERDGAYYPIVRDITTEEEKYLFSYLYAGDSIKDAIYKTDSNVATLAYEVVRNEYVVSAFAYQINNSVGLNEYAEYVPKSSANYISDAKSLVDADNKLDAAIKSANDSIDSLNNTISNIHIPSTVAELTDSSDYYTKSELTRVSQLYNDSEYQRKPEVESIVSTYIAGITHPTHGGYLYLEDFDKTNLQNALTLALASLEEGEDAIIDCTYFKGEHTVTGDGFIINNPVKLVFGGIDIIHDNANGTNLFTFNTNNISIVGLNRNTDKSKIDNGATIFRMTNPDTTLNGYHIKSRGNKNLEIKDITFVGLRTTHGRQYNNASYPLDGVGGIYIEKAKPEVTEAHNTCNNVRIENILIAGSKAHGIYIDTPILSTFKNIRLSDCGGHGIFVNAGTSLLLENIYSSSANFAGFCIYGATYVSLNNCVSENSGIGFWIRSSFNVTLTSPGVEETRTYGNKPWQLSQPISGKYGLGLTTLASDNSTVVDIVDVTETASTYFIGYGILITGGRSINIFTPYIKSLAVPIITEAYPSGTSRSTKVKYINVLDNNRETYILNPSFKEASDSEIPGYIKHEIGIAAEVEHLELVYSTDETILTGTLDSPTYVTNSDLRAPIYCKSPSSVIRSGKSIVTNYSTPNAPATNYEFANKEYVDGQVATKAPYSISYNGATYPEVDDINSETEGTTYIFVNTYEGTSLEQYVRNVDDNVARLVQECLDTEFVVSSALNQFNISAGFDEQVKYVQNASAQYISGATSLADADNLLDSAISAVANSVSNMHIPTTVAELTDAGNYATTTYVASELAKLVNSAPDKLNTLDELAAALGDDENFATTVTNQIASKANKTITGDSVKYREIQDINNPGTYFFINSYDGIELEQFVRNVDANTATLVNEVCKNEKVISTAINQLNVSSGFGEDAKYAPNTTATYISSATSLVEADNMLDSAISDVYSALDNYATKTELSAKADNVLGSDYTAVEYQKIVNVNNTETEEVLFDPVVAGDTIANAIKKLDQNISTLVDETVKNELVVATAVNVLNESCGFGTNAKYVQYTGGYAIADAKSLYAAILALDAKLQAVANAAGVSI